MAKKRKKLKVAGLALLLLAALVLLLLATPLGWRALTPPIERAIERALGATVTLEGLAFRLFPFEVRWTLLRLADEDTTHLEVRGGRLALKPGALRHGVLRVRRLHLDALEYHSWPSPQEPAQAAPALPDPRRLSQRLVVEEGRIDELLLTGLLPEERDLRGSLEFFLVPTAESEGGALSLLFRAADAPGAGRPLLRLQAQWSDGPSGGWRLEGEAAAHGLASRVTDWPADVPDEATLAATFQGLPEGVLRVNALRLEHPLGGLQAEGHWNPATADVAFEVRAAVDDLAPFSALLGLELRGDLTLLVGLKTDATVRHFEVRLTADELAMDGWELRGVQAHWQPEGIADWRRGAARVEASLENLPVSLSAAYRYEPSVIALEGIEAAVLGVRAAGHVRADTSIWLLHGELELQAEDLSPVGNRWNIELQGHAAATVVFAPREGSQGANLHAMAGGIETPWGGFREGRLYARLRGLDPVPRGDVVLSLDDPHTATLFMQHFEARVEGDTQRMAMVLRGHGVAEAGEREWSAKLDATADIERPGFEELTAQHAEFSYGELTVRLEEPLRLARTGSRLELDRLALRVGPGLLRASGWWSPEEVRIDASVTELPLSAFGIIGGPPVRGELAGQLRARGSATAPRAELRLEVSDLAPADESLWAGPPVQLSVTASLAESRLETGLRLEGLPGAPVTLEASMPLRLSLQPPTVEWPPVGRIEGRFRAAADLGQLASLFALDVHRLEGRLMASLDLAGTVAEPELAGLVVLQRGRYEHVRTGTLLHGVEARLSGHNDRIVIERVSAGDGDRGRLELTGQLLLQPEQDYPFDVALTLRDFRLLNHDALQAVGSGALQWQGSRSASRVEGRLSIAPVEVRIAERLPPNWIELEIEEEVVAVAENAEEPVGPPGHRLTFDAAIAFSDRFFVRGRGLDSEWSGELRLGSDLEAPTLTGSLAVVRGRFDFFGKRLALARGLITFDGAMPPAPHIDLMAEGRAAGMTARLRLTGDVAAPIIELDADPSMPEDEILARLLFGREAARVAAWQALTIASAVNSLRGGGSTWDLMGRTRRALRVDQLELRGSDEEDGDPSLHVGKYVSDRVYIEIGRGIGPERGRAVVEVELTPSLRVQTEFGIQADAGLGLSWSWDY